MIKTKQELLNHFSDINTMYNNPFMYQTLSNMIDELLEQQPCEDAISREETLKLMCEKCPVYNCVTGCQSYRSIENMPSVTPTISEVENDYNIGYNCGYNDAMSDVADMGG